jgi:hypothetical protein
VLFKDGVTDELIQKLNLDETIVKPLMHSLSCGKTKVLLKSPASNKIYNTDKAIANIVSNLRMFRIPTASLGSLINTAMIEEELHILIGSGDRTNHEGPEDGTTTTTVGRNNIAT